MRNRERSGTGRRPRREGCALALAVAILASAAHADEAETHGGGEHGADAPLHFAHPLVAESPSPDRKARLDYLYRNEADADRHTVRFEGEYAFSPSFSLEVDLPYTFLDRDDGRDEERLDSAELGLKYANFHFAEQGWLLGGGLELGLPTGDEAEGIGSNHVLEVEPFLDFGYKRGDLETVGFLAFGIPTNENGEDEADLELGWNLSFLYHVHPRVQALLELDGTEVEGGEEDGFSSMNVTPGVKVAPLPSEPLWVGAGLSLPVFEEDQDFDARGLVSVFYHF